MHGTHGCVPGRSRQLNLYRALPAHAGFIQPCAWPSIDHAHSIHAAAWVETAHTAMQRCNTDVIHRPARTCSGSCSTTSGRCTTTSWALCVTVIVSSLTSFPKALSSCFQSVSATLLTSSSALAFTLLVTAAATLHRLARPADCACLRLGIQAPGA